uniref:PH domain-containing protein n=1 Tax=Mesocestoides corti TaxID=53468 RepID=A0A5K3FT74_MESCO
MNYLESPHSRSEIMAQTNKRRGQRSPVEPSFMSVPLQYDQRHTASTSDLHIACGPNGYAENDNSRGRQTFHRERRHIRPDHIRPKRPISAQIYAQNSSSESRESLTNVHLTLPRKSALRRAAESLDSTGSLPTMQGPHEPNELLEAPARKPPAPLHGVILKNRKRPMKGWHERFFSLNNGCLAYAKTSNSLRQGRSLTQIDLANTCVTAAPEKLGIDIDAASLVCHLKFEEPERFQQWLTAIREHRAYDQYRNASLSTGRPGASQPTWSAASTLSGDGAVSTSSGSSAHTGDSLQGVGKTKVKRLPKVQSDFSLRPPEHLLRHSSEQITAIENLLRKLESIYKNLQDTLDESVEQNKRENDTDTTSYSPTRSLFFSPVPFPQADATSPNTKPSQAVQHSRHSSSSSMTSMYTAIQEADTLVDDPQLTSRAQSKIKKGINLVDFATEFTKEAKKFIEESNGALATLRLLNSSSTYATSPSKERASTLTDANKV